MSMRIPSSLPKLTILGAASGLGQKKPGLECGPGALRNTGLVTALHKNGWNINDLGDVSAKHLDGDEWKVIDQIQLLCRDAMSNSGRVLLLGGDHSVSIGSIRASLKTHPKLKVLWIDAHGDMNTPESSPTGNLHGMPLATLLGLFRSGRDDSILLPENLCLMGVRSLDPAEIELIDRMGIAVVTADQIRADGIEKALADSGLLEGSCPIHLSLDIDALDPTEASATGILVPNGLHSSEVLSICEAIGESQRLVSMDLVEVNPLLATSAAELRHTLELAHNLILTAWSPLQSEGSIGGADFEKKQTQKSAVDGIGSHLYR